MVVPTIEMALVAVLVVVAVMVASAAMVMVTSASVVVVRAIDFEPSQLMLLVLKEQGLITLLYGHFSKDVDDFDQAEGV